MARNPSGLMKVTRVMNGVVAGTSNQTSSAIDMQNFDTLVVHTSFGAITGSAVTSVKLQQSSDDAVADAYDDLLGSGQTVADTDDNKVVVHELYRPQKRYVKVVVLRGTANAVIDGVVAMQFAGRHYPTVNDSTTVVARKQLFSPAEGTA